MYVYKFSTTLYILEVKWMVGDKTSLLYMRIRQEAKVRLWNRDKVAWETRLSQMIEIGGKFSWIVWE